jgi:beta-glucuronidase
MKNPGYTQLHSNPIDELKTAKKATAKTLLCGGRQPFLDLSGDWHASPDIYDNGIRAHWYREEGGEFDHNAPCDYDFEAWDTIPIPSSWNCIHEAWSLYEGSFWFFRKTGPIAINPGERVFLMVGAANYECMIFVNGIHVASHEGGYTPFCADISDALAAAGDNRLLLWVSNARRPDAVPADFTDWFNYGGVHRDIGLIRTPQIRIHDWFLRLGKSGKPLLTLSLSAPAKQAVRISISGLVEAEAETGTDGNLELELEALPETWSPEHPRLYDVKITTGGDKVSERIGFRTIETRGGRLYLNGRELFLRGITSHEESVEHGRALSLEERLETLHLAAEMNCNFMRLAHYPHSGKMAALADELGILLWEEIPVYWSLDFSNPATLNNARNQLLELMKRDHNRASVIIWAVGNENPDSDERFHFMKDLIDTAKSTDSSRLVSAACLIDLENFRISDRLAREVDVVGLNEYFGWYYYGWPRLEALLRGPFDRPVVVSEFGAEAVAGLHGPVGEAWTEEYQAEVYRKQLEAILRSGAVSGLAPWLLYDFKTPRRLNSQQKMYNLKGLVDRTKKVRKLAFNLVRQCYEEVARR